ncbi:hypothetical protein P5V15_012974 [Pogonomyrmex californicus]
MPDAMRVAPLVLLVLDRCPVATAAGTKAIACPREMYYPSGWIPRDYRCHRLQMLPLSFVFGHFVCHRTRFRTIKHKYIDDTNESVKL